MYCKCGCGRITSISRQDQPTGVKKGEHMLFVKGHAGGMARRRTEITPDLWAVTDLGYDTPCWIWRLGSKNRKTGHSHVWISGKEYSAHRTVYEHFVGAIPDGLELDHLCRHPRCVNPDHLEPVTRAENARRSPVAKLTQELVEEIRASTLATRKAAKIFGVSASTISSVRRGNTWK